MIRVTDEAANDYEQISAISLTDDRLEALYKERFARKARIDAISVDIIRQIRLVWEHNFITRNKPNLLV
ncbi:MAG: hypothetical protein N4A36_03295 [Candidatus Gracilibacteria bacterium]|jgi:hypothetical protein|nr:hypothetical protein [Candidatus Gracilibacteria bacterium]